ncbi:2'-5' RNA ligase family protein [Sphingomonas sp. GCM10030256]|uniref:2'-5' RNA ligase family protein n=1 Tax=Sphingomonas sp. GCM10030256 TaxID=3273427 RepID=UPI00360B8C80
MSALIVTAELGVQDFAWLDRLRREHFPPERNQLPAHLTLFHALPPSADTEIRHLLATLAARPRPAAEVAGLINLGRGVAFRVVSVDLEQIRGEIADHFHGSMTSQDAQGWRPHVTVQNKVEPKVARALLHALQPGFRPRPLAIAGLGLHRYLGGPWERLGNWSFRGVS